jgi:hypothetical protein
MKSIFGREVELSGHSEPSFYKKIDAENKIAQFEASMRGGGFSDLLEYPDGENYESPDLNNKVSKSYIEKVRELYSSLKIDGVDTKEQKDIKINVSITAHEKGWFSVYVDVVGSK